MSACAGKTPSILKFQKYLSNIKLLNKKLKINFPPKIETQNYNIQILNGLIAQVNCSQGRAHHCKYELNSTGLQAQVKSACVR